MKEQGPSVRIHLGFRPNLAISSPEAFEKILSSNTHITKVEIIFKNTNKISVGDPDPLVRNTHPAQDPSIFRQK
jgi:hypothetical protein